MELLKSEEGTVASKEKLLVWMDESRSSLNTARQKFLRTVKDIEPKVLNSLHENILPVYRPLYDLCGPHYLTRWYILKNSATSQKIEQIILGRLKVLSQPVINSLNGKNLKNVIERRTQTKAALSELIRHCKSDSEYSQMLICLLEDWSKTNNLQNDWCLDYAIQTLALWSECGVPDKLDWQYQLTGIFSFEMAQPFQFEYRAWKPEVDTWLSYKRKLDAAYKIAVNDYGSELQRGAKPKLAYDCLNNDHYLWLVRFQVGKLSAEEIFAQDKRTLFDNVKSTGGDIHSYTKTYRKAIRELAKFIDLSLRKIPPGRPSLKRKLELSNPSK